MHGGGVARGLGIVHTGGAESESRGPLTLRRLSIVVWFSVGWRTEKWSARNIGKDVYEIIYCELCRVRSSW
jgi:hypothetical protein